MKKLVYLLIAVSLVLALVPTVALAHTADAPLVVDLLAGQTEDIGDVKVWNDAEKLYVQFVYEGPDCGFLEVHLQVDEDAFSEDILTKKGNPIPGQFEKSYKPGWCFNEHTFAFDLVDEGFGVGDTLKIAAHAALGLEESMTIVSDTSTAVTEVNGTPVTANAVLANEPVGYPNCASYAPDGTGSAWDSSVNISGAHWIWNTLDPVHPIEGDVVTFNKAFTVPGMPNGGTLYITADNGYEVTLNGVLLGSAQLGPGFPTTLKETTDTTPQAGNWGVASQGWQSVESYALTELVSGENTLVIIAANEYMWNTTDQYQGKDYYYGSWDPPGGSVNADPFPGYGIGVDNICRNPGGLIFKATMGYYASGETAWGAGTRFTEDKNWATYFTYTVQEPPPPVIAGWDTVRGGNYSLNSGDSAQARADLETEYGDVEFRGLSALDATSLADVDVVVLSSVKANSGAITPWLSEAEQDALYDFVLGGGCAILFPDNSTFAGGNSDAANESLIDPFGLDIMGTLGGGYNATVTSAESPVTSGVASYLGNYAGWFDGTGGATVLATITVSGQNQTSLVEFAPGHFGTGSGRVVVFSDANVFFGGGSGRYSYNTQLFLNSVDACFQP
jgi:hypothetical protein